MHISQTVMYILLKNLDVNISDNVDVPVALFTRKYDLLYLYGEF